MSTMIDARPISFRLAAKHREALEHRAQAEGLRSPDLMAQRLVLAAIEEPDSQQMDARLAAIEVELSELRKDLSVATEALLAHAGRLPEKDAMEWTKENLKTR